MQPKIDNGGFRYLALADALEAKIRKGIYRAGEKMPSIRRLHADTGLSITTVYQAFIEMEKRGLVTARQKSGYYVRPLLENILPVPDTPRWQLSPQKVTIGNLAMAFVQAMGRPDVLQLGGTVMAAELLPTRALSRIVKSISGELLSQQLTTYEQVNGSFDLRRQIAQRTLDTAWPTDPDRIVTTHGCIEAVTLSLQAVAGPGDTILVESPTFPWFLQVIEDLHMYALEIPTDPKEGIDLAALAKAVRHHPVKAAIFMANFHNPLGCSLSDEKKRQLVHMLQERDIPIIEDDIYGDLFFGKTRPRPLKAYDRKQMVLYCASFSKTLSPGLRVGWCQPGRFLEKFRRLKLNQAISSAALGQHVVSRCLQSGGYDRHLRRIRTALKNQVSNTALAIARHFPAGTRISAPQGGLTLWIQPASNIDSVELFRRALKAHIAVLPGAICSNTSAYQNCFRVSCGAPWSRSMEKGIRKLAKLVDELGKEDPASAFGRTKAFPVDAPPVL